MKAMTKERPAPCERCPGHVRPRQVTVDLRRRKALVVVHHVPAYVCDRCGYREFTPGVVDKLQLVLRRRVKLRRRLKVPVVEFDAVA